MRKCSDDCYPICDFCKYYRFNGDECGCYIGEGFCNLCQEPRDPWEGCDDFYCFSIKDE